MVLNVLTAFFGWFDNIGMMIAWDIRNLWLSRPTN